jgi:hypothetical protein
MEKAEATPTTPNPTQTKSTLQLYEKNIVRLCGGLEPKQLNFLKNVGEVMTRLESYKPTTQRSYVVSILHFLKDKPKFKKAYDFYYKKMMEYNAGLSHKNTKSQTQNENWISQADVVNRYVELAREVQPLFSSRRKITKENWNDILRFFVLALYVQNPPRRNADYQNCVIVKKWREGMTKDYNYFDLQTGNFIFGNYKTNSTYGIQMCQTSPEFKDVIKDYMIYYPNKAKIGKEVSQNPEENAFLLCDFEGNRLTAVNAITRILNKIFDKKIGVSMLRNIYLTDKYADTINGIKDDATSMGTSSSTIQNQYVKLQEN